MLIKKIITVMQNDFEEKINYGFNLYIKTLVYKLDSDIDYFNHILKYELFVGKQDSNVVLESYIKSKKIKNTLDRFVKKYKKYKYKKYEIETDLRFIPFEKYDKCEIIHIIENKTVYSFRILDLIHLLKVSLYNNENMFSIPLKLKNPYTNIYFKKYNLYNILIAFNKTKYILPEIVLKYYRSNFDFLYFKLAAYPILQENAIEDYIKNGYIGELYDYILTLCHYFRKETNYILVKTRLSLFRKSMMISIFKKTLQYYLKKKYLCNPLKKDFFENKSLRELKNVIEEYGDGENFIKLNKLQSIRYEASSLISDLNSVNESFNSNVLRDAIVPIEPIEHIPHVAPIPSVAPIPPVAPVLNNLSSSNFIFRRSSTYLQPINPFRTDNELPRSPRNNQNNIRDRLSFGF